MNFLRSNPSRLAGLGAIALAIGMLGAATAPAVAQPDFAVPYYNATRHTLVGMITYSAPYRLTVQVGPRGRTLPVDLKNGTIIHPTGTSLAPGMHVVLHGYWSNGTFIANRVVVR